MRKSNWTSELYKVIDVHRKLPFRWGESDCAMFAADVVKAITGVDPAEDIRGTYDSKASATAALNRASRGSLYNLLSDNYEMYTNINMLRRGDIVLRSVDRDEALGVCVGKDVVFKHIKGITMHPITACTSGWRID